MPATTAKGVPYAVGADPAANIDTIMQTLAEWVDASPGIRALTTAQRNALAGADLWAGRVVWDVTLGHHFKYNGAAWIALHRVTQTGTTGLAEFDASAAYGAVTLERAGATANGDVVGLENFYGQSSTAVRRRYGRIEAKVVDITNGSEDAYIAFYAMLAGVETEILRIGSSQAAGAVQLINEILQNSDGTRVLRWGTGTPEGVVTAGIGSVFLRKDGAAGTIIYAKETGAGNTGWVPVGGGGGGWAQTFLNMGA